jgi:hypothetical protein
VLTEASKKVVTGEPKELVTQKVKKFLTGLPKKVFTHLYKKVVDISSVCTCGRRDEEKGY